MSLNINDIFQLPEKTLTNNQKIDKTLLVRMAGLTAYEQKQLNKIKRLEYAANIQKSSTYMAPHVDAERDIQACLVLRCEMAGDSAAYAEMAYLLHKCFPNPTIIVFEGAGSMCISVAITRRSLAERGASVVDVQESTGAFTPSDKAYEPFLNELAYAKLPQADLLVYLEALVNRVRRANSVRSLGYYPECRAEDVDRLMELIAKTNKLAGEIEALRAQRRDKELSLNESAKLRMQSRKLEQEHKSLTQQIEEICHG